MQFLNIDIYINEDKNIVLNQQKSIYEKNDDDFFVMLTPDMIDSVCKELQDLKKVILGGANG